MFNPKHQTQSSNSVEPIRRLVLAMLILFVVSCGSSESELESSHSLAISSASSSSSLANLADANGQSALDWDWTQAAKNYCDEHRQQVPVAGEFQILRPTQSDQLHPSEHFVLRWNNGDGVNLSQSTIDKALATLEDVWRVYIDTLGFPEPYRDSPTKYKVSVNVSDQGYASGAGTGQRDPEMWVHYDALLHVGTLAHEFAHTLQFTTRSMRDSQYVGWLWESHANWMAHQYNPKDVQCTEALVNAPHIYYGSTRNRYCNWQFFEFVKDNSCTAFVNDALWKNGLQPETPEHWTIDPFTTLADNTGWSTSQLNDIFADWALHNIHWDYANGTTYRAAYGDYNDSSKGRRFRVTRLQPTGVLGEYSVPHYWAPQRWGYNLVRLVPDSGAMTLVVDFEGVIQEASAISAFPAGFALQPQAVTTPNSEWRWAVVATLADGSPAYYPIQRGVDGQIQVAITGTEQALWLLVMATPREIQPLFWDQIYYSIYRYPWRIKLNGARPAELNQHDTQNLAGGLHVNGGGWVSAAARVENSVFVAPSAKVLGRAQLSGQVRIEGSAVVDGTAVVRDRAVVRDFAYIGGSSLIEGSAVVRDYAAVYGGTVTDTAAVGWLSLVDGNSTRIANSSIVEVTMNSINGRSITGSTQLRGDIELNSNVQGGVFYGFVDQSTAIDPSYGATRTAPVKEVTAPPN